MPAGEAVNPKERARFVDESASVARGHGEVWKRGLQVEAPDATHIAGTYTFAYGPTHGATTNLAEGCPRGYPIWKKDDGTYITYGVTDFPSQVTWYFGQQDAPVTVSASWPHAHLMRQGPQAMTTVAKDGPFAIINQTTEWEKPADPPAEGLQKIQITIRQIPHPKHEEDSFMYCQTWKVPPGVPTEQDQFTQFLAEFRTSLLPGQGGMRTRNSIDDTIKQVLCPPKLNYVMKADDDGLAEAPTMTVDEFYEKCEAHQCATPATMADFVPVSGFHFTALTGEPRNLEEHGFEKALGDTLEKIKITAELPHGAEDWDPLIQATLDCVAGVKRKMPKGLGFEGLNDLCDYVLQVGDQKGLCISACGELIDMQKKSEEKLQKSHDEVEKATKSLLKAEERTANIAELEVLSHTKGARSGKNKEDALKLRRLLKDPDLADGIAFPDPAEVDGKMEWHEGEVKKACVTFQKGVSRAFAEIDQELERDSATTLDALKSAVQLVLERIGNVEGMAQKAQQLQCEVDEKFNAFTQQCTDKIKKANKAVEKACNELSEVQKQANTREKGRVHAREAFEGRAKAIKADNERIEAEIRKLAAQLTHNETELRGIEDGNRDEEEKFQKLCACDHQRIGVLAGCHDEMESYRDSLQETQAAAEQIKSSATLFLTGHAHSVRALAERDIERHEKLARELDVDHEIKFCAAFTLAAQKKLRAEVSAEDLEAELTKTQAGMRKASLTRNHVLVDEMSSRMETLEAQVEKMDTEKTEVDQRIAELTTDAEPVLERLGKGYGAVQQRRKLQLPRDEELLAALKSEQLQASRPEQGVQKLKEALYSAVVIDMGKSLSYVESEAIMLEQGADEARERNLKLLLGHSYNPTQLEDSSMQRAPSVPDGEALSHCSSIDRQRTAMAGAAMAAAAGQQSEPEPESGLSEGEPPAAAGGFRSKIKK